MMAAGLMAGGMSALAVAVFAIFMAIVLGSDEPEMAKPWWIAGLISGLWLFFTGLALLIDSVIRARRTGARPGSTH